MQSYTLENSGASGYINENKGWAFAKTPAAKLVAVFRPTPAVTVLKSQYDVDVEYLPAVIHRVGGLDTSPYITGAQWDNPYDRAPVHVIACDGLKRHGDSAGAGLAAQQFPSMVAKNFRRDETIGEKYNVVTCFFETQVIVGYSQNQVGFGWTRGAYLVLRDELSKRKGN